MSNFRYDHVGRVFCNDTDRLVAKFSHSQEAKTYCELLQKVQQLELAYKNIATDTYCDICYASILNCEC